jgi:hypothetical protein
MSMHKKHQASMRQGVILERDRCMRIAFALAEQLKEGLNKKLMTAGEKHIADVRMKIGQAIIAAIQMQIMSGEDPNAEDPPKEGPGFNPDAVGGTQGNPDGGRPA